MFPSRMCCQLSNAAWELVQSPNAGSKIRVETSVGQSPLFVRVDSQRLTQATLNLLLNAVEAAGDNGDVVVRLRQRREHVEIEIEDSDRTWTDVGTTATHL